MCYVLPYAEQLSHYVLAPAAKTATLAQTILLLVDKVGQQALQHSSNHRHFWNAQLTQPNH